MSRADFAPHRISQLTSGYTERPSTSCEALVKLQVMQAW
jgi:hypothetical protein